MPFSSVFQLKLASVNTAGIVVASLNPEPLGPRKRVHPSSSAACELSEIEIRAEEISAMIDIVRFMSERDKGRGYLNRIGVGGDLKIGAKAGWIK